MAGGGPAPPVPECETEPHIASTATELTSRQSTDRRLRLYDNGPPPGRARGRDMNCGEGQPRWIPEVSCSTPRRPSWVCATSAGPRCSTAKYQVPGASSAIGDGEPSSANSGRATGTANQNGEKSPAGVGAGAGAGCCCGCPNGCPA